MTERDHRWLGAHLFFDGDLYSEECDRVVLEVAAPLVERLGPERWFFIRYKEDGPHVRLRCAAPAARLTAEMQPEIERAAAASPLVRRLAFIPYEPEVERYGGPHGVQMAEELFHRSSVTAVPLLEKIGGDPAARSGKAMLAMLVLWHTFCQHRPGEAEELGDRAARLAEHYGKNFLRARVRDPEHRRHWLNAFEEGFNRQAERLAAYVEVAWQALATGEPLTAELDLYRDHLRLAVSRMRLLCERGELLVDGRICRDWSVICQRIVPSHVHMMNNRLGVSIRDECYLAMLIHRTLGVATVAGRGTA